MAKGKEKDKFYNLRKIATMITDTITNCSEEELKQLLEQCRNATSLNCWWLVYKLKDVVSELVKNEERLRTNKSKCLISPT